MTDSATTKTSWRKRTLWGIPVLISVVAFGAGIIFWGGFNTAMEATNTLGFCVSCHEMEQTVYQEYKKTIHYQNRTGVRAECSDCHVPDPWVHKMIRKIKASNELVHKVLGTIDTPEKFEERRLYLARRVWKSMKATDSRECRNCHNFESMSPEHQQPRARNQHQNAFEEGLTCIDCHKGIAHKNIRDLLEDGEREALEAPNPKYTRPVPVLFAEGMERAHAAEAAAAEKKAAEEQAAREAIQARVESAVAPLNEKIAQLTAQVEKAGSGAAAAAPDAASGQSANAASPVAGALETPVDWNAVPARTVTLFYPGQASFEWIQNGKDHGGSRAFTKAGDRCSTCHANEVKSMGELIASGEKAEETPIPGKRPHVEIAVQAAHDDENLYLRFQWPDTPHAPVPFADGGKLDPDNQAKLAMMIAGENVEYGDQAGCWVTCHHDERFMPDAPDQSELAGYTGTELAHLADGVTKYLADSRTDIEIRGKRGAKRGGWDKPKSADELAALPANGTIMDLIRYRSGGEAENGSIVAERIMAADDDAPVEAAGTLEAGVWTVILKRPLQSASAADISLDPAKIYTVGFALHDDYASARFHHVSLDMRLGFGAGDADIVSVKQ